MQFLRRRVKSDREEKHCRHPPSTVISAWERSLLIALGLAMMTTGAIATFIVSNGTAPATMLAVGVGLTVLGLLGDRLLSVKLGGFEFVLRRAQALESEAVKQLDKGNVEVAERLQRRADSILASTSLVPLANRYESIRASMPGGLSRTGELENLLMVVRQRAKNESWTADGVIEKFHEGGDGARITALAVLEERPELNAFPVITEALQHPRSNMEQYHALIAAEVSLRFLDPEERRRLQDILGELDGKMGGDRQRVLERILRLLETS